MGGVGVVLTSSSRLLSARLRRAASSLPGHHPLSREETEGHRARKRDLGEREKRCNFKPPKTLAVGAQPPVRADTNPIAERRCSMHFGVVLSSRPRSSLPLCSSPPRTALHAFHVDHSHEPFSLPSSSSPQIPTLPWSRVIGAQRLVHDLASRSPRAFPKE